MPRRIAAGLLVHAGLLFALGWHAGQFSLEGATRDPAALMREYHAHGKRTTFAKFAARDEFMPRSARRRPARPRAFGTPPVRLAGEGRVRALPGSSGQRVRVEIDVPAVAVLEQLYLPGWEIALDGRPLEREALERSLTPEGFARVEIASAGRHRLDAAYEGPPGGGARGVGMAAVLAGFAALLRRPRARFPAPGVRAHV